MSFSGYQNPKLLKRSGTHSDENQIKEAFNNEGQGHSPSHLKFFLLIFAKVEAQAQEGQAKPKPKAQVQKRPSQAQVQTIRGKAKQ